MSVYVRIPYWVFESEGQWFVADRFSKVPRSCRLKAIPRAVKVPLIRSMEVDFNLQEYVQKIERLRP